MKKTKSPYALGGRTWAALLIFGLFGQIAWVIENMYFNVFLYNTISGDTAMIAAMVSASAVTATVTTLVMGALSDKIGRRKTLIVVGYLLWGLSVAAFAFVSVDSMGKLFPAASAAYAAAVAVVVLDCVMTFFGSTANDAAFNAWVTDVTVPENRGRVETVLAILPLVAMLVVFGLLDGMTQSGNWSTFFLVVGGVTLLGGVLGIFFLKEKEDLRPGTDSYFANIVYGLRPSVIRANPGLYISLTCLAIYSMSQQVYMPYLIIYIQRFLGITDYVVLLGSVLILSSVISVLMGKVVDKHGKLTCIVPAAVVGIVGLVLMYFARAQWFVAVAGIVMLGGGMVVSACCQGLIRDHTPEGKAGLFQGIRILFQVLIPMVTGPFIGVAVIRNTGMTYEDLGTVKQVPTAEIFLAAAVVLVLLFVPVKLLKKREAAKGAN
ncbi:MAG: MFS transporter [Oscillospiraceae bacterium]|nr:MFS transporter [Oscillospiraceae bacterium]